MARAQNVLVPLAALGVGGYLLYVNGYLDPLLEAMGGGDPTPSTPGGTPPTGTPVTPPGTPPPPPPPQTPAAPVFDLRARILDQAAKGGYNPVGLMFNWDQWNYHFELVRGVPGPPPEAIPELTGKPREYKMTVDEYLNLGRNHGIQGLGGAWDLAVVPAELRQRGHYGAIGLGALYPRSGYAAIGRGYLYDYSRPELYRNALLYRL